MGEPSYNASREESEETRRRAVLEVSKLLDTAWHSTITKNGEYHFMNAISNAHRDNPKTAPDVAVETYLKYGAGASLASPERSVGRKAGKRQEIVSNIRLMPDVFVTPALIHRANHQNEALVLRRERLTSTSKRSDFRSAPGHLAFTRHALQRIHSRGSAPRDADLGELMRSRVVEADKRLSYAWSAGIYLGSSPTDRSAATAIPFLEGLLLIQNRLVSIQDPQRVSLWLEARAKMVRRHPTSPNPLLLAPCPDFRGKPMTGLVISFATTYVPREMLRPVQEGYADWFLRRETELPDDGWLDACFEVHASRTVTPPSSKTEHFGRQLLTDVMTRRALEAPLFPLGFRNQNHPDRSPD
ncbi:MAG: hypothetical protein CL472_01285 [Acidobacteria bacterium]|nr:hypothetical protein [Acidobacteriota bacterium]